MWPRSFALVGALITGLSIIGNAMADPSLTLDSSVAFTSNADLSRDDPSSDLVFRIGGVSRFSMGPNLGRFVLHYTDYSKHSENDSLSAILGTTWPARVLRDKSSLTFGLRALLSDYVHDQAGTTDESFTHYGVAGSLAWERKSSKAGTWTITPQVDLEHYPKFADRSDIDLSTRAEFAGAGMKSEFTLAATPGLLVSTENDFSKFYLSLSADYEQALTDSSHWGASVALTPSLYTSRTANKSTVVLSGRGKRATATTLTEKEETLLLTPGLWWSKALSLDWEFRADSYLNVQSSKSDAYSFTEFRLGASVRYRAL